MRKIGKSVCSPSHAWIDLHRYQRLAQAALRQDLQDGAFSIHAVSDQHIVNAYHLIEQLANLPLRTLDALHLAIAQGIAATGIASADAHQIAAAKQLHFAVYPFTSVGIVKAHE